MKQTVTYCARCLKPVHYTGLVGSLKSKKTTKFSFKELVHKNNYGIVYGYTEIELCEDCTRSFKDWLYEK